MGALSQATLSLRRKQMDLDLPEQFTDHISELADRLRRGSLIGPDGQAVTLINRAQALVDSYPSATVLFVNPRTDTAHTARTQSSMISQVKGLIANGLITPYSTPEDVAKLISPSVLKAVLPSLGKKADSMIGATAAESLARQKLSQQAEKLKSLKLARELGLARSQSFGTASSSAAPSYAYREDRNARIRAETQQLLNQVGQPASRDSIETSGETAFAASLPQEKSKVVARVATKPRDSSTFSDVGLVLPKLATTPTSAQGAPSGLSSGAETRGQKQAREIKELATKLYTAEHKKAFLAVGTTVHSFTPEGMPELVVAKLADGTSTAVRLSGAMMGGMKIPLLPGQTRTSKDGLIRVSYIQTSAGIELSVDYQKPGQHQLTFSNGRYRLQETRDIKNEAAVLRPAGTALKWQSPSQLKQSTGQETVSKDKTNPLGTGSVVTRSPEQSSRTSDSASLEKPTPLLSIDVAAKTTHQQLNSIYQQYNSLRGGPKSGQVDVSKADWSKLKALSPQKKRDLLEKAQSWVDQSKKPAAKEYFQEFKSWLSSGVEVSVESANNAASTTKNTEATREIEQNKSKASISVNGSNSHERAVSVFAQYKKLYHTGERTSDHQLKSEQYNWSEITSSLSESEISALRHEVSTWPSRTENQEHRATYERFSKWLKAGTESSGEFE